MGHALPGAMWPGTDPVGELVKERQARIELIGARTDGENPEGGPRHAGRMDAAAATPADHGGRLQPGQRADPVDQLGRPRREPRRSVGPDEGAGELHRSRR